MKLDIELDINIARKCLEFTSGSSEQAMALRDLSDEEVAIKVIQHIKCWGISLKEEN